MEKICRFCLKVSVKNMCSLQECDILYSIQKFLTIKIPAEDSFPSNLCKECFKQISQLIKFCITLKENEDKLQYYSRNGQLQNYYSKITNDQHFIEEQNELKMDTHLIVKVEDIINTNFEEYDDLKNEEFSVDIKNTHSSSDDEKTLSSIKEQNEISPTAPLKKKTKIRPIINLIPKRKKKKEPEDPEYVKPFTCLTCLIQCNSQADLSEHYYTNHLGTKIGHKNYEVYKSEDKTTYSCKICEKTYNLKKDIVKHVMTHNDNKTDERPLICKLCARMYRTVPDIVRHARAHNGFRLQCPYNCGFSTAYAGAMKEHKNRHLDEYKYTCKTCGKGFNIKTWYEQHQNLHTGHKPFVCNICGVAFPLARYLQTHKSSIHPQSSSLKRYQCVHCDEKCDSTKSLAIHLKKHGINKETYCLCDFCGKIVASTSQLEYHHRMHLGVKPFSCHICNKTFAKKYNVQLHMTTHTGDKPHVCVHCGKQYSQRSTLLKHMKRYHGGETSQCIDRTAIGNIET